MTDHLLENLIQELRTTIDESDSLAGEERARLEQLTRRIEDRVEEEHQGLADHIGDSISQFETDHPALVQTLNRIAQTLNAAGI